nr:LINE-type retrotransposon LIb DNA [Ipomoea batatas]
MLVTKKPKPGDTGKNTRNSKKASNTPSVNHGNQFSLLADINEDSEPTINRQHADKNKSRTAPRQTSKGKHSTPPINSPPVPPQSRTPLPATISTPPVRVHTQTARNRGGRPAAARGRGRELGRVHGLNHDIPHTNSSFTDLMNQPNSHNVFQFGGAHPLSSNMTGAGIATAPGVEFNGGNARVIEVSLGAGNSRGWGSTGLLRRTLEHSQKAFEGALPPAAGATP